MTENVSKGEVITCFLGMPFFELPSPDDELDKMNENDEGVLQRDEVTLVLGGPMRRKPSLVHCRRLLCCEPDVGK